VSFVTSEGRSRWPTVMEGWLWLGLTKPLRASYRTVFDISPILTGYLTNISKGSPVSPILTGYLTNISKGSPVSPILTGYLTNISKGSPVNDYRSVVPKKNNKIRRIAC